MDYTGWILIIFSEALLHVFFKDHAHVPQFCTRIQELTNLIQAEKEHMGLT